MPLLAVPGIAEIERARLLLAEHIRRTPLIAAAPLLRSVPAAWASEGQRVCALICGAGTDGLVS